MTVGWLLTRPVTSRGFNLHDGSLQIILEAIALSIKPGGVLGVLHVGGAIKTSGRRRRHD